MDWIKSIDSAVLLGFLLTCFCREGISKDQVSEPKPSANFECRWAEGQIAIDGKVDDQDWAKAQRIDDFYLPWLGKKSRPAKTTTRTRLLWDREYLYFYAEMNDSDLFADVTKHDGHAWENDVFELFFKPTEDKPGYYEFQVNTAGAVLDIFWPKRDLAAFDKLKSDGDFHIDVKVIQNGTLNQRQDKDHSWAVEGRIPWQDFIRTGGRPTVDEVWQFALCRYDYSVDAKEPELSTCVPLDRADFHRYESYGRLRFVGPNAKSAEVTPNPQP